MAAHARTHAPVLSAIRSTIFSAALAPAFLPSTCATCLVDSRSATDSNTLNPTCSQQVLFLHTEAGILEAETLNPKSLD